MNKEELEQAKEVLEIIRKKISNYDEWNAHPDDLEVLVKYITYLEGAK